jgi:hypothetical protein
MFCCVWGAFGVAKGRQAGRIMETVAIGLLYLFTLPAFWVGFFESAEAGALTLLFEIIPVLISAYVLVLSYGGESNRYIHLITVARSAEAS